MEMPQRNFLCSYFKQTKMAIFFSFSNQRAGEETGPNLGGRGTSGRGEEWGKGTGE
jgi:hypothetical protein